MIASVKRLRDFTLTILEISRKASRFGLSSGQISLEFLCFLSLSMSAKLDLPPKGRRKKQEPPPAEDKKSESIHYNCTIKVAKEYVLPMFDDKAERLEKIAEILYESALRMAREERQKLSQEIPDS